MTTKEDTKTATAYSIRNWLAYRMASSSKTSSTDTYIANPHEIANTHINTPSQPEHIFLERAYHGAMVAHRRNEPHVRLLTLTIFMAIESGNIYTANEMLNYVMDYRSFLKTNEPFYYCVILFLRAYMAARQQHTRATKKFHKAFTSCIASLTYSPYHDVMQGQLNLAMGRYHEAYAFLTRAYDSGTNTLAYNGSKSVYLYEALYRCYSQLAPQETGKELLPVLIFAASNGADISHVAQAYAGMLYTAIIQNPAGGERLYALTGHPSILRAVCTNRMRNADYSATAYKLYSKAADHQINIKGLADFLVQSACFNQIENINRYFLEQFITSEYIPHELINTKFITTGAKPGVLMYAYHLLLTKYKGLLHGQEHMIIKTAQWCLENDITRREANSIYHFYWVHHKAQGKSNALIEKAEALLYKNLTQFELTADKGVQYVFISSPQKREADEYVFPDGSNKITISAASDEINYVCLGAARRSVMGLNVPQDSKYKTTNASTLRYNRVVATADPTLYQYFFDKSNKHDKSDISFNLLAYLASYYLKEYKNISSPHAYETIKAANPVFEVMLKRAITKPYRMQLLAALGYGYFKLGDNTKALEHYSQIDVADISAKDIQEIVITYLKLREYGLASELIVQMYSIRTNANSYEYEANFLCDALYQLFTNAESSHSINNKGLAQIAYDILLEGIISVDSSNSQNKPVHNNNSQSPKHESKNNDIQKETRRLFLNHILTHHKASQEEWKALSWILHPPDPYVDTKILSGDVWMHNVDIYTQKAFRRLYTAQKASQECQKFIDFCSFAMLTQGFEPEYDIINLLEKIYTANSSQVKKVPINSLSDTISHDNQDTTNNELCANTKLLLALCSAYLLQNITTLQSDGLITQAVMAQEAVGILLPAFKENKPHPHPYLEKYQPFLHQAKPDKDIRLYYSFGDETFKSTPMQHLGYGLYTTKIPLFFNETVMYYFSEEMPTGSITTPVARQKNTNPYFNHHHQDNYFAINNAVIYEQMFRYEEVEKIVDGLVKDSATVRAKLL